MDGGDEVSSLDTEDVGSSARYNSSAENNDGYDTAPCNNDDNKALGGDILNQCELAIDLYKSQSEDSDKNDCVNFDVRPSAQIMCYSLKRMNIGRTTTVGKVI